MPDPPTRLRGKQKRKEHWIYDVEKALGLNHSDIARLLTPEPLSIDAVWDILEGRFNTPALCGLRFPISVGVVSDIIAGESLTWLQKAEALLSARLGFKIKILAEGSATLLLHGDLQCAVADDCPFGDESVATYLGIHENRLQYEFGRVGSPFVTTSPPVPFPPSKIIRIS